ncbi:MAG: hypothetical protein RLZZ546_3397, partial [Bacteroidota bacterium]
MCRTLLFLFIAVLSKVVHAQRPFEFNFENKINKVENFHNRKFSILNYYDEKLKNISNQDSTEKKAILRDLKKWNRKFWIDEYYLGAQATVQNKAKIDFDGVETILSLREENTTRDQSTNWANLGPLNGDDGVGRADVIAFHPTNNQIIYTGTPHGGLFVSYNAGNNWSSISSYLPSLGIAAICINPTNPNIIYVLSGDRNGGNGYDAQSLGAFKTIDGGGVWTKLSSLPFTGIFTSRDMIMDPNNPNKIIVSTSDGIATSLDGGASWFPAMSGTNIYEIKFKPGNGAIVYAVGSDAFYKSTNGGLSFANMGITELSPSIRISMAVTPDNPNKIALFAGKSGQNCLVGVFISNDSGNTFVNVYNNNSDNLFYNYLDNNVTNNQVTYNNCIAIHPYNENTILVGGLCVWTSHDGGYTWSQTTAYWPASNIWDEYIHPDQHDIEFNGAILYIANDGGVYKSVNGGTIFDFKSNGLSATQFFHFERKNNNNSIWGGAQDNGIMEHGTNGNFETYFGGDGYDMMTDHDYNVQNGEGNNTFYTVNEGIRRYSPINPWDDDISVPGNTSFFGNLAMSPNDEDDIW